MIKILTTIALLLCVSPAFAYISNNNYTPYFNRNPNFGASTYSSYSQPTNSNNYERNRYYKNGISRPSRRHCHNCDHNLNSYIPNDNLSALERYALRRNFSRENELARLERLENLAFGATQNGDINSRYRNVENAILSRPQNNGYRRSFWGNVADYFSGQMTGYTPALSNFDMYANSFPYTQSYGNSSAQQFSNGIFGSGWGIQNQNFGNGSRVRILD